jgi:hypothetical protein
MNAKLKGWFCPDIDDLLNYEPEDPDNFCFLFSALVGPNDTEGEESFDIEVCTPQWFLSTMKKGDIFFARHFLIVLEYDFEKILNRIRCMIESCSGKDWKEVAEKVSRIGFWEFEDYVKNL